jgi:NAD(P)-dependent dehydrogenase (short-subunit alcohol dehydrogenase family)
MMAGASSVLSGKVAVVTGAAQGIGLAIARRLSADGAKVVMIDANADALATSAAELPGEAGSALVADLAEPSEVLGAVDAVLSAHGRADILVNNAGRRGIHDFTDYPLEDWSATLAVNLTAPFLLARGFIPPMAAAGGGRIVNIASVAADLAFSRRSAYNASKSGLVGLTRSIALECAKEGIRCNAVSPGIIETPLNADYLRNEVEGVKIREGTPTGAWGQVEDIAGAVAFLCGPDAEFINGQIIRVDGGWTAGKGY